MVAVGTYIYIFLLFSIGQKNNICKVKKPQTVLNMFALRKRN